MRHSLRSHPDFPASAVTEIAVEVIRHGDTLALRYLVSGQIDDVLVPATNAPERADELWGHTCFEAFIRGSNESYLELNFSPSTQWAAYRFGFERDPGRTDEPLPAQPDIALAALEAQYFELRVKLALDLGPGQYRLGLSAVIEERDGTQSYWALAHPPGAPDFHHPDCFALELPAARSA
jgi:hypothetical protein